MNKIIKNTLILAAITVVSGLVLGAAYEVTKDPIAQTQAKQKQEACQAVYPEQFESDTDLCGHRSIWRNAPWTYRSSSL